MHGIQEPASNTRKCIEYKNACRPNRADQGVHKSYPLIAGTLRRRGIGLHSVRCMQIGEMQILEMQATSSQLLIPDGLADPRVCDLFSTW